MIKSSNHSRSISSNDDYRLIADTARRASLFRREAKKILATHESSPARAITIEETYKKLSKLSVKQDDLIKQVLRCTENELYRAAHVMAWAAFMDFLEVKLATNLVQVNSVRPKWKVKSVEDLRDIGSDFQVIDVLRDVRLCTRTEEKALKGLLNKRNECAHPTDYYPGLNETLGYISEILRRLESFQKRRYDPAF